MLYSFFYQYVESFTSQTFFWHNFNKAFFIPRFCCSSLSYVLLIAACISEPHMSSFSSNTLPYVLLQQLKPYRILRWKHFEPFLPLLSFASYGFDPYPLLQHFLKSLEGIFFTETFRHGPLAYAMFVSIYPSQ